MNTNTMVNIPIKIIWKFKNKNRRIQYHICIFLGNIYINEIEKSLKKIKDLDLYNSLIILNSREIKSMIEIYGEFWYKSFFNSQHIVHNIQSIKTNQQKKNIIIEKFGNEWYVKHIDQFIFFERKFYSYATTFANERKKILKTKIDTMITQTDDVNNYLVSNLDFSKPSPSISGGTIDYDLDSDNELLSEEVDTDTSTDEDDEIYNIVDNIDSEEEINEDVLELEKLYEDQIEEKNINNQINELIENEEIIINKYTQINEWDTSKDNNAYDEDLKNVYSKIYIFNQCIFYDDNILTIKKKITAGIKKSLIFDKQSPYIIPSRMYLWSEYEYEDPNKQELYNITIKKDKIMIGQKWIKQNELLNIDIEPNDNIKVYESLRGSLNTLKDSMNRYGSRIRRENEETNILLDYIEYITNNELYMIDIYNELGSNYNISDEKIKNIYNVYCKLYFNNITQDELKHIIDYLSSNSINKKNEMNRINNTYLLINNDLLLENEIVNTVETTKLNYENYKYILRENYITQAVIHINFKFTNIYNTKQLDLFRLYDNYIVDTTYPFLQYQTNDNKLIFKFYTKNIETDKNAILSKWFETTPYGISFKIKVNQKGDSSNKYISVSLSDSGKMEYKITWKEDDKATMNDVYSSYKYIKDLVIKINNENEKLKIIEPKDEEFKFAFINTIQQFSLDNPENKLTKYNINHNDLSDFARYFFPYVALVIEPRKRQSKTKISDNKSKYGTYLRYKRISKYENESRVEQRILYFIRNYEYNEKSLISEISKQFNLSEKVAEEKVAFVREKYPNIKKSRKILKKFVNIPKYKPPGIGIDIQGRKRDQYKIRISGARSKTQLNNIILFMNILIYLYIEIYLKKNQSMQYIKNKLKLLTNVAKRKNKVEEIIDTDIDLKSVKLITKLDKERLGFRPEKGQNQWTRSCQNSGTKKRRPLVYTEDNLKELINQGFIFNNTSGYYEKKIDNKTTIRSIELASSDGKKVYYVCTPEENKKYTHVGFLSKSANPYGICMPCCFKKDQLTSNNKKKIDYFLKCVGKKEIKKESTTQYIGDKLYILQNTEKLQEGRFCYLPKYLDIYLNLFLEKKNQIKNHYLVASETGYFFKYGTIQDENPYLNAVANCVNLSLDQIKENIINILTADNAIEIFTFINNGDTRTQFVTIDKLIEYIQVNTELDYTILNDLLSYPGIILNNGLNIITFEKIISNQTPEVMDYNILCNNNENLYDIYDERRKTILLIKEDFNWYPIVMAYKARTSKNIDIIKQFEYNKNKTNIINHITTYMKLNCMNTILDMGVYRNSYNAKQVYNILINEKSKSLYPIGQIIDKRNKCNYLIIESNILLPVKPSGIVNDKNIKLYESSIDFFSKYGYGSLDKYFKILKNPIIKDIYTINSFILEKKDDKKYIIGLLVNYISTILVTPIKYSINLINKYKTKYNLPDINIIYQSINDIVDKSIALKLHKIDKRIESVNQNNFLDESYELFRYEISNYITNMVKIKVNIESIINDDTISKHNKKNRLIELLNKLRDNKSIYITNDLINDDIIKNYKIKNVRTLCSLKSKNDCSIHCRWDKKCKFALSDELFNLYISKLSDELVNNELKANEILQKDNYYISDIVDLNSYTARHDQKIIKDNEINITRVLSNIFGKDNIPNIGKYKFSKTNLLYDDSRYPLIKTKNYYSQLVNNDNVIFRTYANCYYWLKNIYSSIDYRNLGYISRLQTEMANYFRSLIAEFFIHNKIQVNYLKTNLLNILPRNIINSDDIDNYSSGIFTTINIRFFGIIDLLILNFYHSIPIIVYTNHDEICLIIDKVIKYIKTIEINYGQDNITSVYNDRTNYINIKYYISLPSINSIISDFYSIYYI